MSKDCKISFETALEILQNPVFGNETEHQGAVKFVSEAFNMSEDAILEELGKVKIVMTSLNEDNQEERTILKYCKTIAEAEDFYAEHEQEYVDNPDICALYIEGEDEKDNDNSSEEKLTSDEQGFIDAVELALDFNFPVSDEDYEKYKEVIKKRAALNNN